MRKSLISFLLSLVSAAEAASSDSTRNKRERNLDDACTKRRNGEGGGNKRWNGSEVLDTDRPTFSWSGKLLLAGWLVVSPSQEIIKKREGGRNRTRPKGTRERRRRRRRKLVRFLGNTEEEEEAVATKEGTRQPGRALLFPAENGAIGRVT